MGSSLRVISAFLTALLTCSSGLAVADADFSRPVRLIVPFAAGGGQDTVARLLAAKLTTSLGSQVIVDNKPGGGTVVASEIVAGLPADGHTLYLIEGGFAVAPSLHHKLSFDPVGSFTPIARVSVAPGAVVVHPSLPVKSMSDLVSLAKKEPGRLSFGSAGIGTSSHLAGELLKMLAGIDMIHVPYKGSANVTIALLNGEVALGMTNPVSTLPHVKAGKLKLLAVTTAKRVPTLPDIPTVAEAGVPGFENAIWNGVLVRSGTPDALVQRLNREIVSATLSPSVKQHLARDGAIVFGEDQPEDFAKYLAAEITKWGNVMRQAGITAR